MQDITRAVLLQLAEARLVQRPEQLEAFKAEVSNYSFQFSKLCWDIEFLEMNLMREESLGFHHLLGATHQMEKRRKGLLSIIDRWAANFPEPPPVEPLSASPTPIAGSTELPVKTAALKKMLSGEWPSIGADINEASRNGLSIARAGHGLWHVSKAKEWAVSRGKLQVGYQPANWLGPITRHKT